MAAWRGAPAVLERLRCETLDAVLGVSVTPTTVGWVLAEGHGADGVILEHHELALRDSSGLRVLDTAEQVAAEVLRAKAVATASDHRLRIIGVTWNDEASAQSALLLEALAGADFDNVVPVQKVDAVQMLARAVVPIIGYEQTAVCILEHEWATVVLVDTYEGETQTVVKHVRGGFRGLTSWLAGMFDRGAWCPEGVVVVGSDCDMDRLSWQLEKVLPVPVFAQTMAQVTVARGAALAAAQSTEFTDAQLLAEDIVAPVAVPARSRYYTRAATTLAAATVTFVGSLSLAVGLHMAPAEDPETAGRTVRKPLPRVAEAVAPAIAPSTQSGQLEPGAAPEAASAQEPPVKLASGEQITGPIAADAPPDASGSDSDPNGRPPLMRRVLDHIPGTYGAPDSGPPE